MFTSIAAVLASNASEASAPFNALEVIDAHAEYAQMRDERRKTLEMLDRTELLIDVLREHGSQPSLMAFVNHDGALSSIAGAAPVAALESMSSQAREADAESVICAMEGLVDTLKKASGADAVKRAFTARREAKATAAEASAKQKEMFGPKEKFTSKTTRVVGEKARAAGSAIRHPVDTARSAYASGKDMARAHGKTAGYATLGVLAAAGTIYAVKRLMDASVPGTAAQTHEWIERAQKNIEILDKVAGVKLPESDEGFEEFVGKLKSALGDYDTTIDEKGLVHQKKFAYRNMPVFFSRSGFTAENAKELAKDLESVHGKYDGVSSKVDCALGVYLINIPSPRDRQIYRMPSPA